MMATVALNDLPRHVGREVAVSDWFAISQPIIDEFAEATRDAQWIHVDTERAARESPFLDSEGRPSTVAHGFLTLSLLTMFIENCVRITGARAGLNVGFDRVRFVSPVPAGTWVRGRFTLARATRLVDGMQLHWDVVLERHGQERPALVAEWVTRLVE
jgi:acyl dehydratase